MDKVEKMLEEMKKVWNTELDCICCRKTFRLGDMFAICGDCYTSFLKKESLGKKPVDARIHKTKQKEGLKHD